MKELAWLAEARKHIGLKEIPGAKNNPVIQAWLKDLGAWWQDDATPWCGVFAAHCLKAGGRDLPKNWFRAKEYETFGLPLKQPAYGCVVTFTRQGRRSCWFRRGRRRKGKPARTGRQPIGRREHRGVPEITGDKLPLAVKRRSTAAA